MIPLGSDFLQPQIAVTIEFMQSLNDTAPQTLAQYILDMAQS